MDARTIKRMAEAMRAAAAAAHLEATDVMSGRESVAIVGTGVDVAWSKDALGRDRGGWLVSETYHVVDVATRAERFDTRVLGAFPRDDVFQAARLAVMSVIQRRVEAALSAL